MSMLLDAGLVFLLRFALDDSVEGVMAAAVHALRAFLVCAEDEVRPLPPGFFIFIITMLLVFLPSCESCDYAKCVPSGVFGQHLLLVSGSGVLPSATLCSR